MEERQRPVDLQLGVLRDSMTLQRMWTHPLVVSAAIMVAFLASVAAPLALSVGLLGVISGYSLSGST